MVYEKQVITNGCFKSSICADQKLEMFRNVS